MPPQIRPERLRLHFSRSYVRSTACSAAAPWYAPTPPGSVFSSSAALPFAGGLVLARLNTGLLGSRETDCGPAAEPGQRPTEVSSPGGYRAPARRVCTS